MLDHIVYTVPDVAAAVDDLERRFGARATPGGKHPGVGTHNALLSLGDDRHLEIIGPDPEQPPPAAGRPWHIDELTGPRVGTWMAKAPRLEDMITRARAAGYDVTDPTPRSRQLPDGSMLLWRLGTARTSFGDGALPNLIEWQTEQHPSLTSAKGCRLIEFRAEHPEAGRLLAVLSAMGLSMEISVADAPALIATIETPKGVVELR